jgi:Flp pilus assembly protein TadG
MAVLMKITFKRPGIVIRHSLRQGFRRKTQGQAFLEAVLIIPTVFMLVLGTIAIGLAFSYKMKVEGVAREATRVVAKNTGNGSIQIGLDRAREVARQYGLDLEKIDIDISGASDTTTPARGGTVTAKVTYRYQVFNFAEINIVGKNSEIIECWRKRDDENSGGTCVSPDEQ